MAENSSIEWTDHTFNPWIGCTKVSPGCAHCYAEKETYPRVSRARGQELWGKGNPRHRTSATYWRTPLRLDKAARVDVCCGTDQHDRQTCYMCGTALLHRRPRVFCASLADWLDDEVPIEWLADLLQLIHDTPNLDWLLLTKRPENWQSRLEGVWRFDEPRKGRTHFAEDWLKGRVPANVWLGATVEDLPRQQRIIDLLKIPARIRFLSCEPLLEGLQILNHLKVRLDPYGLPEGPKIHRDGSVGPSTNPLLTPGIHWVICGGESGKDARPMHPDWARSLRDQCTEAGVPFLFKQWGEWGPAENQRTLSALYTVPTICCENPPHLPESMYRFGKKWNGRLLDGLEHNEFPNFTR